MTAKTSAAATPAAPLSAEDLRKINAYWRACNYLAAGMIYLRDKPAAARTAGRGAHQEPAVGPLGRESGAVVHVRAHEPHHPRA